MYQRLFVVVVILMYYNIMIILLLLSTAIFEDPVCRVFFICYVWTEFLHTGLALVTWTLRECVHIYTHVSECVCVYIYIYIYTHTHILVFTQDPRVHAFVFFVCAHTSLCSVHGNTSAHLHLAAVCMHVCCNVYLCVCTHFSTQCMHASH